MQHLRGGLAPPCRVEFQRDHIQVQERREMIIRRCFFTVSTKHEIRHFHVKTAKKCTKIRDVRAK